MNVQRIASAVLGLALTGSVAACSSGGDGGGSNDGKVTITVQGLPPKTAPAARKSFQTQIAAFEKANPTITVKATDASWDAQTFAAKLAGGRAETVITVPLTEPQGLIARHQVKDLTSELKSWPQYDEYNPKLLAPNKDAATGKVYGLTAPVGSYSMGLVYNRALFAKAGLDPDKPPTTWDELRQAAKAIHDKTGKVGYAETTTNNTGGWHLTSETYSRGGTMEKKQGERYVPAFTGQPTKDALQLLHDMRFVDNSMGSNQLQNQQDVWRRFGAGEVGMFLDGPSAVVPIVQQFGGRLEDFGAGALPQDGGNATQLGGSAFMVNARATQAEAAAGVKWILFKYVKPYYEPEAAAAQAKTQSADPKNLIGVPEVAGFSDAVQQKVAAARKPYVNVPQANFRPYVEDNAKLELMPEPPVAAQKVYAALDPVVQAVLTKKDADPAALLDKAAEQMAVELEQAK
ncbi:ABC transporter substrate-binding protein [Streptomyces sp. NPDC059717]|uniref:ABC transporter substrate-binding protein n=1 Tax=Streptomyces sp. NPDC059717 TaxID=3346922 RepID=UPI003688E3A6